MNALFVPVAVALKSVVGLLSDKVGIYGATKLSDGDVTDEYFRRWIVRDLDNIRSKLDGWSRKDLRGSITFLEEGVELLHYLIYDKQLQDTMNAGETSVPADDLKIKDIARFEMAKVSFKQARRCATVAFFNSSLSVEDRILASKVRIVSGILQWLEDPQLAAIDGLQYLQELHDMKAIQEIFCVYLRGGLRSRFNRTKRLESVKTVVMINVAMADFISKFTKRRMAVFDWPMINCVEEVVHPIHFQKDKLTNLEEMIPLPWVMEWPEGMPAIVSCTVNSKGDIICVSIDENQTHVLGKVSGATGLWQLFSLLPGDDKICNGRSVATDDNDMVYVLSYKDDQESRTTTLSVHSSDGEIIRRASLEFIEKEVPYYIAVTKDEKIVICSESGSVFLCDRHGKQIRFFVGPEAANMRVSCVHISSDVSVSGEKSSENEIVAICSLSSSSFVDVHLYVYTQEGRLKRSVKLYNQSSRLNRSITFDPDRKDYILCSACSDDNTICVEFASEHGGQQARHLLDVNGITGPGKYLGYLVSHANGTIAMVNQDSVIYLRLPGTKSCGIKKIET